MFSKTVRYSLRSILYLAAHTNEFERISIDELAAELDTPKPVLAGVMQRMARYGLINSRKGRNGGFYLTDEQRSEPISKVLELMAGRNFTIMNSCILGRKPCDGTDNCPYHLEVKQLRGILKTVYQDMTLRQIAMDIYKTNKNIF